MQTVYEVGQNVLIKGKVNSISINSAGQITYNLTGIQSSVKEADIVGPVTEEAGAGEDVVNGDGTSLDGL